MVHEWARTALHNGNRESMTGTALLEINGKALNAAMGMGILEIAQRAGIRMPHDCDAGHCEACRIRLLEGTVSGGDPVGPTILACKAGVNGSARLAFDPFPLEMKTSGVVRAITELTRDIVEIVVEIAKPVPYMPGQYVKVTFAGTPERDLCPTLSLDGLREIDTLHFHLRRYEGGRLASKIGQTIQPGSRVKIRGPFGQSFLRQGEGRLIMVSSSTGFSAIWSMAVAARMGQPHRPLVLIASARDPRNLYMRPALDWLAKHDVSDIIITASAAAPFPPARHGRASDYLPALLPSDTVYAAGEPDMVRAIIQAAAKAKARFYAIPFGIAQEQASLSSRISGFFGGKSAALPSAEPVNPADEVAAFTPITAQNKR